VAITGKKGASEDMSAQIHFDHLEQIRELNREFLGVLQSRARMQRDCLGLPPAAASVLCDAGGGLLDEVARFPRALFQIDCAGAARADAEPSSTAELDPHRHHLTLQILWTVRHTSRHSPHQARVLFNLDADQVMHGASLTLPEIERLAGQPHVLRCAFRTRSWLWPKLLTDVRPESRRHLSLIALQPGLTREWPRRRAPQPVH
jgi:hypothetical protein